MPIGFDVNQPASMDAMVAAISPYASQSAAESDIPTDAQDYLNSSYQRLTGDQGSNIFNDVFNARTNAATAAAANPMMSAPAATKGGMPSQFPNKWSDREVANSEFNQSAEMNAAQYRMAGRSEQLPPIGAENYTNAQRMRATALGVGTLFDRIAADDPNALTPKGDPTDLLLQRAGAKAKEPGKIQPGDDLHHVVNNPVFQEALRRNPQQAMALYSAITGGRDFETDRQAQVGQIAENTKQDQNILGDLQKTGKWNPILGSFTKMRTSKDLAGNEIQTETPISDVEQAALDRNGGALKALRIDNPSALQPKMSLGMAGQGLSPQEERQFRTALFNWSQANPSGDINKAKGAIYNQLLAQQKATATAQNPGTAAAAGAVPGQPSLLDRISSGASTAFDELGQMRGQDILSTVAGGPRALLNLDKGALNLGPRAVNAGMALAGSSRRIPLIPDVPRFINPASPTSQDVASRQSILDMIKNRFGAGATAFAGP